MGNLERVATRDAITQMLADAGINRETIKEAENCRLAADADQARYDLKSVEGAVSEAKELIESIRAEHDLSDIAYCALMNAVGSIGTEGS